MAGTSVQFNLFKALVFFLAFLLIFPILAVLYYGYGPYFSMKYAFGSAIIRSIELTFFASSISIMLIIILFTPLAYYLARHRNPIIEAIVDIPASVPHPVVGIALLFIDSPLNPLGRFLETHGINFFFTYLGLILALMIVSSPIYVRAMQNFYEALPRSHEYYALSLGASELRTYFRVILPSSVRGIISAGLTSMARAISEFGSVVIVAPYVSGWIFNGVPVASVCVYNTFLTYFNASITEASTLILFSLILVAITRVFIYFSFKREGL
ncbi:ABC transporter permease subunit [Sulfurisphaera ohwakuensis]|uniref:ABC transporter permease subunit n=1 Tax=Sulfurisphaera ohwakuensis TaxID=69656 RepID=UPI0036F1F159